MSAKPVAWRIRIGDSDGWGYGDAEWQADFYGKQSGVPFVKEPLYAESPAQAHALAIQEAAKVCEQWQREYEMDACCDDAQSTALKAASAAIRSLSPAPSVTEEWVAEIINSIPGGVNSEDCYSAVRATLAALGVEVK